MKKLPVSLIAVCAVILAITSAFSTRIAAGFFILDTALTQSAFTEAYYDSDLKDVTVYHGTIPATSTQLDDASCTLTSADGNDLVCALQFTYSGGSNPSELENSEFPANRPTTIKYKPIP